MFDIGFSELVVVGVVALIVIGPERLPKVARTAGHLMGRFQRYAASVKSDISREMQMDELRKVGEGFKASIESAAGEVEAQVNVVDDYLKHEIGQAENSLAVGGSERGENASSEPDITHLGKEDAAPTTFTPHPQQSFDLDARPTAVIEYAAQPDSGQTPAA